MREARGTERWVRLRVNSFDDAVRLLRERQLISESRDGSLIALGGGYETDEVVRVLVENRFSVYEVARADDSLESFYLSLVQRGSKERQGE